MVEWFDEDILGDELLSDPEIAAVHSIICEKVGSTHAQIKHDIDTIAPQVEYRALLTLSIIEDGEERYVGDLNSYNEGMKQWAAADLRTKSTAQDSSGFARCSVCDEETECFGLGAKMGEQYAVKQQWPFPGVNSSEAWRNRPLCMDCLTAIEVASDRFLETQSYGVPGIHCRVIPYTLPMPDADEQLKELIHEARFELAGGNEDQIVDEDNDEGIDENEEARDDARQRPLSTAWEVYRQAVKADEQPDALRLAFSHIYRESTKTHGVAWIDGVSIDQVVTLQTGLEDLYENDPMFEQGLLPQPDLPTERQVFSGSWLLWLLAGTRGSDHRNQYIGDETPWVDYTERLLTDGTIDYNELVAVLIREIRARYRDRLGDDTEYPYDGYHLAATYGFLRLASAQGILRDTQTQTDEDEHRAMTMNSLDGSYTSFGDGIREFVAAHPSIDNSPGRTAAFVLGAAAAQLSNWQAYRNLSRTFVQTRDVDQLTAETLTHWQTDIWEKAKVYNSQAGRYGVPWSDAESLFHEATLAGENEGWQATAEEIRYHYVLGVNVGPNISQQAKENRQNEDVPPTEDGEPVPNPAIDADADEPSDEFSRQSPTETNH
jgi:hypothetical protein